MLISFLSAKGSPGVTTTVLALASRWPAPAVVVEADPMGGDMLAGVGGATVPATRTVLDLVVAARQTGVAAALPGQLVRPAPHCPPLLAGVGSPAHAAAVPWGQLGAELARLPGRHVLADCGRYVPGTGSSSCCAAATWWCWCCGLRCRRCGRRRGWCRCSTVSSTPPGAHRWWACSSIPGRPYGVAEIEQACGLSIVGALPADPRTARVWSDGHRRAACSPGPRCSGPPRSWPPRSWTRRPTRVRARAPPAPRGGGGRLAAVRPAGQRMRGAT